MTTVKAVHMFCAMLSFSGFFMRGLWMLNDSPLLRQKWVKIVPHIVDTVLLGTAITLAFQYRLAPQAHPWLLAKIISLLLYIYLGMVALKWGKTKTVRTFAWMAGLATFIYIVSVARTKLVSGFFGFLFL